jgi:NADH dehydrogenase [ubiquinone] 1 alpha subcomplex assembly factor 7
MSLLERLRAEIAQTGPLTVAQYMSRCLHDPQDGYYAAHPALGEAGDFITAPLVSQMFGELIGLWAVEAWSRMGRPGRVRLIEVGPGDGTLMADVLRAARLEPAFLAAADVWLVETSRPLTVRQQERLAEVAPRPHWTTDLEAVPGGAPVIVIANELLDCLPARQFVRDGDRWAERMVGASEDGLAFGLSPRPLDKHLPDAPDGAVLEASPAQETFGAMIGALVAREGGAALLIDYGRAEPGFGDTLQALRGHEMVDPLACPGEADLTVHADFPAVLAAAGRAGAQTTPVLGQGEFLSLLGIEHRAAALSRARPDQADILARQLDRLTAPKQMGELFKAACIHSAGLVPPAFETAP